MIFLCQEVGRFFLHQDVEKFLVPRGWVIFFCAGRVHDFSLTKRLRDFFVQKGCAIFFVYQEFA